MNTASSRRDVGRGFTLVELLVVVGVITILIALLLPALSKTRIYAKKVQCMSNLRQCGMAVLSYGNENKGMLPYNDGGINVWDPFSVCMNTQGSWTPDGTNYYGLPRYGIYQLDTSLGQSGALNNYIGDFAVWGCPTVGAPSLNDPANNSTYLNSNYTVCWGKAGPAYSNANPRRLAGMPDSAHVVLIQDYCTLQQSGGSSYVRTNHIVGGDGSPSSTYTWSAPGVVSATNPSDASFYLRVSSTKKQDAIDGINAVFLDFHVEWVPGISVVSGGRDSNGWEYGSSGQRNFMTVGRSAQ